MKRIISVAVDDSLNNSTVKYILKSKIGLSGTVIKRLKKNKTDILLNNMPVHTDAIVKCGDVLQINISYDSCSENIVPVDGKLDILYEDDDILIINKLAGIPVHPSPGNYMNSIANYAIWYLKEQGINTAFRAVNRLDSCTSGLMVIAKNSASHTKLIEQIHTNEFKREYIAIVCGNVTQKDGEINAPIARKENSVIERTVSINGNKASTHFTTIINKASYSVLKICLETGRTHQIRVHMKYIGHPLAGDFLYGTEDKDLICRPALHSYSINIMQPFTGKKISVIAPLPEDMRRIIPY